MNTATPRIRAMTMTSVYPLYVEKVDDRPLPAPFRGAVASTDEESTQPGIEPVGVTQTANVEPGLE